MNKENLSVNQYILKISGVFEAELNNNLKNNLKTDGYVLEKNDKDFTRIKNYWYPEFRNIFFTSSTQISADIYSKHISYELSFLNREHEKANFTLEECELFFFKNGLNLFSLNIRIETEKIKQFSDACYYLRLFEQEVSYKGINEKWVEWIEKNILTGIEISSKADKPSVKVDDYSGSKFKLFMAIDFKEQLDSLLIDELLYDIGSVAKIGSAGGNYNFSPSESYFNHLLENKISVFKNWSILPLFDTFTAIGFNFLSLDRSNDGFKAWAQSYYRVHLYNLFVKYSLFKYNSEINDDILKLKNKFTSFINTFYYGHISYNFLPNLIMQNGRKSLEIDAELELLKDRIEKIGKEIEEERAKKTNLLISIITFVASASSISPVIDFLQSIKTSYSINSIFFYTVITLIVLISSVLILLYLYPKKFKKFLNKNK